MQNNFYKISLIFSAIFFLLSCFAFLFFYRIVNNNNEESQIKEIEWQNEENKRGEVKALDRSIRIIESERAQLETHFARSSDIVPFLDTIEGLAPKVGVKAEIASVDISKDKTGLVIGLKASGTFSGIYKFLTLLENSPYEIEFTTVNMSREAALNTNEKKTGTTVWNAVFKIKLLSFVE